MQRTKQKNYVIKQSNNGLFAQRNFKRFLQLHAIRGIIEKPLEYWNKEKGILLISSVITSAEIDTNKRQVKFTINENLGIILKHAKEKYSRYNFEVMLNLSGRYSKRLYLHCNAWRKTGVWEIQLEKLRKMLGVTDKYEQFYDFHTKILLPAFQEINEKSEYITTIDFLKNGKQYNSMLVSVTLKKEFVKENQKHWTELKRFGLADWQIKNVTNTLSEMEIERHLNTLKMNQHAIRQRRQNTWPLTTELYLYNNILQLLYFDDANSY